ncbi:MAG: DUF6941 family protein [Bacillota bacterium]|uniref:DUF6941 family protein n=1 Tax=Desulfurispora thermophila TaxID=265470 RepID=UPI0003695AEB|nr:hypothetical protein [Desulfurispora thermophila]
MQPGLCLFLLCDHVALNHGKYNLQGVFYRVHAKSYPCRHACYVVLGWYGRQGQHLFTLRFWAPDQQHLLLEIKSYPFHFTDDRPYVYFPVRAELPLFGDGTYWFEVLLNDQQQGLFPLLVQTMLPGGSLLQ